MIDTLEFLMAIAVLATIVGWYWRNEQKGAAGGEGFLALNIAPPAEIPAETLTEGRYRQRQRLAPDRAGGAHASSEKQADALLNDPARRAYRYRREETAMEHARRLAAEHPLDDLR